MTLKALCIGGAERVFEDIHQALALFTPDLIIVANTIGKDWPGKIHAWCSLHPYNVPKWAQMRANNGYPPAESYYTRVQRLRKAPAGYDFKGVPGKGGASGMLTVRVARDVFKATHIVLAGIPMSEEKTHYNDSKSWKDAPLYRDAWIREKHLLTRVRSVSGWTGSFLGRPTVDWLTSIDAS